MKQLLLILIILITQNSWAEKIIIDGTPKTPTISFDTSNGVLEIKGVSTPDDATDFYMKLNDLVDKYFLQPNNYTIINLRFKEIDSDSVDQLLLIFSKIEKQTIGTPLITVINWHYEEGNNLMKRVIDHVEESIRMPLKVFPEDFFYWNVMFNLKEKK